MAGVRPATGASTGLSGPTGVAAGGWVVGVAASGAAELVGSGPGSVVGELSFVGWSRGGSWSFAALEVVGVASRGAGEALSVGSSGFAVGVGSSGAEVDEVAAGAPSPGAVVAGPEEAPAGSGVWVGGGGGVWASVSAGAEGEVVGEAVCVDSDPGAAGADGVAVGSAGMLDGPPGDAPAPPGETGVVGTGVAVMTGAGLGLLAVGGGIVIVIVIVIETARSVGITTSMDEGSKDCSARTGPVGAAFAGTANVGSVSTPAKTAPASADARMRFIETP